ncbi:hypothetical protein [Endozoicomonas sp. YOMI1]|uniref:hypothetical protein n=1 Tax=Endozoicomonas sp. YOMI1 TaxID=2828739 RepID=UPI0021476B97|nr:hypothetical protein [Endozoicomonas sp. YOMI1]
MYAPASIIDTSTKALTESLENLFLSCKKKPVEKRSESGRIIVKIPDVVSQLTLAKANQEIDELPTFDFENRGNKIRKVKFIDYGWCREYRFPSEVTFDEDGKLTDTENFDKNFAPHTESINKMCKEALQAMGRKLNWKDFTVEASCGVLRYTFTPEQTQICDMPWHRDGCNLTMTTLLSPYIQHDNGFTGGELSFAQESEPKSMIPVGGSIKTFAYETPGDGIIFDGIELLHKVKNMHVLHAEKLAEQPVERRLLICRTEPSEDHVRELSAALGKDNLA